MSKTSGGECPFVTEAEDRDQGNPIRSTTVIAPRPPWMTLQ
jgi:hypothetical protein